MTHTLQSSMRYQYEHTSNQYEVPMQELSIPTPIDDAALRQIFLDARTHNKWQPKDVPDNLLREVVDVMKMGPTSANCSPARVLFLKSNAKEKLKPCLHEGNKEKTMQAPVCAIIGYDLKFYEHLPKLFPHVDAKSWFEDKPEFIKTTAFRNGTLQGAYLIIAARALGLDCGPMSGISNEGVDREFFTGTDIKSNFLCNIGYGDPAGLMPRSPRFEFDEMAKILS
jgi:3-hydroxypropanoate dehydrogenase